MFLIGRKTPWTPDRKWEQGKYRKLPVHNSQSNRHIAPSINNSHLYNEDCLLTRPERVIITEGVTDCIALMERGFPAISPVTVQIRGSDWDRLLPKLRGVRTVYICQDNEISQAGLNGALKTAGVLIKHKIQTRLVILPLDQSRQDARTELKERFNLDAAVGPRESSPSFWATARRKRPRKRSACLLRPRSTSTTTSSPGTRPRTSRHCSAKPSLRLSAGSTNCRPMPVKRNATGYWSQSCAKYQS